MIDTEQARRLQLAVQLQQTWRNRLMFAASGNEVIEAASRYIAATDACYDAVIATRSTATARPAADAVMEIVMPTSPHPGCRAPDRACPRRTDCTRAGCCQWETWAAADPPHPGSV